MEPSLYLSAFALLISLISLAWSIHIGNRDKAKLKVSSKIYYQDSGYPYIELNAVNHGRRPVILTILRARYADGTSVGRYLDKDGKRLGESESFKQNITIDDGFTVYCDDEGDVKEAVDFCLEDTHGRLYRVQNVKRHLQELRNFSKKSVKR